jgi:hypothetical protein
MWQVVKTIAAHIAATPGMRLKRSAIVVMQDATPSKYSVGDAVIIEGTRDDGKVGTILKVVHEEYLIALEDGTQVLLPAGNIRYRH